MEQARAAKKLRGAVDEDHRNLSSFQDILKRRNVDVIRTLEDLNETVRRRDIFLAAERRRLTQLANAISVGESFGLGLGALGSLPAINDNENLEQGRRSEILVFLLTYSGLELMSKIIMNKIFLVQLVQL